MALKVEDLFVYPIEREISPVIKIEDEKNIAQELEEYVVTEKLEQNLINFLENYNETGLKESDKVGVWTSGFFGCGKSHFAKILGYLLQDRPVGDKTATEIFYGRIKGSERENEIRALLHEMKNKINSHVIMFQIKAEEDLLGKKSISRTLYTQFLKYLGLSEDLHIAELELELIRKGKYDVFKEKIKQIEGKDWVEIRKSKLFAKKPIGHALFELFPDNFASEEDAIKEFESIEKKINLKISVITDKIIEYVDKLKEEPGVQSPHVVFIVDEIGQYLGVSDDLLLELQTLVERFGIKGRGKIWLIVTAQERLDEIIEGVGGKKTDYAKIMDRFDTKLHLTSDNIVKVLEERILKKKEVVAPDISNIHSGYTGTISFASIIQGANRPIVECTEDNFVFSYPFLPYQLQITQDIFTNIRRGAGGRLKQITGTERSMLGVTQAILKSPVTDFKNSEIGRLATLDEIFDQIVTEIPPDALKDIEALKIELAEKPGIVKRTLKALYLLQQIDWIPKTAENITKTLVNDVNVNSTQFQSIISSALDELVKGRYVICENNLYEYISGAKKTIEDDISRETIKAYEEKRFCKETLKKFVDADRLNRVDFESIRYFDIIVSGDDEAFHTKGEVELKIYSPIYCTKYGNVDRESVTQESYKTTSTIYWLPNLEIDISPALSKHLRTLNVVENKDKDPRKSPELIETLREKKTQLETMRVNLEKMIKRALLSGTIIYDGDAEDLDGKGDLKNVCKREIGKIIPSIYTQFEDAKFKIFEKSIEEILTSRTSELHLIEKDLNLFDTNGNINLHTKVVSEIYDKIRSACDKGEPLTGEQLTEVFEKIPYGWSVILSRIAVAALFRGGTIYLKYDGNEYADYKNTEARDLLTKSNKFKKAFLLFEEEEVVPLPERKTIQQQLEIIFNVKSDDTINGLSEHVSDCLSDMKHEHEKQKIFWEQNAYKLKDIFYSIEELCDNVLSQKRPSKLLKEFLSVTEDIKTAYAYQTKVQNFMDSEDSTILPRLKNLPSSLTVGSIPIDEEITSGYETCKNEIGAIVNNKELIEKWPDVLRNYTNAMAEFKKVYEKLHEKRCEIYHNMQEEITSDPDYAQLVRSDTFALITSYLCEENYKWSPEHLKCINCDYNISEIDSHILSADKKRDMIIAKLTPPPGPGEGPQPKRVPVNLRAASKKTVIKNETEMEEAIGNIRKEIKEHLDKGETVLL